MIFDRQFANHRKGPIVRTNCPSIDNRQSERGFTLIEMTVVIAIIILLAGLVVPAATQMWRERKIADAQNLVSGMLMTARARAIQSGGAQTGLFFFIDDQGAQKVVPITQDPNDPAQTDQARIIRGWQSDGRWFNVFTVVKGQSFTLPSPMRAAPLYAICPESAAPDEVGICAGRGDSERFSNDELKNNDFTTKVIDSNNQTAQFHRNFFTLIFAPNGEMIDSRDVIIRDVDDEADADTGVNNGAGSITGLKVKGCKDDPIVTQFYPNVDSGSRTTFVSDPDLPPVLTWIVTDTAGVAINFPSVDGLLVYDDSLFIEAGEAEARREYLKSYGMPFYINRITGAVICGPVGEVAQAGP